MGCRKVTVDRRTRRRISSHRLRGSNLVSSSMASSLVRRFTLQIQHREVERDKSKVRIKVTLMNVN